jgi:hypothetical protein
MLGGPQSRSGQVRKISEEQKDMWVNEIFEGREKMWNSTRFFLSCWNNRFIIISECCPKHFGTH